MSTSHARFLMLVLALGACGRSPSPDASHALIFGGEPVADIELRGVVAIASRQGTGPSYEIVCTGTLIHPQVVLTAGHCVEGRVETLRLYVGSGHESGLVEASVEIESVARHPMLRRYPLGYGDYAVVKLREPLAGVEIIEPLVDLTSLKGLLPKGGTSTLVGYGRREDDGKGVKYRVDATVTRLTPREAVIGGDGKDACSGDSGGPALVRDASGAWRVVGVISRALSFNCGDGGYVGLVADVACWIEAAAGIELASTGGRCSREVPDYGDDQLDDSSFLAICLSDKRTATQSETIEALELATGADTCADADAALRANSELVLDGWLLRDLSPLASMTHLTSLSLRGNHITKVAPLSRLTALRTLRLDGNDVSDIDSLADLEAAGLVIFGKRMQLRNFFATDFLAACNDSALDDARRQTVRAVLWTTMAEDCDKANERLLAMRILSLPDRGLADLTPLSGLATLEALDVSSNPLTEVAPLATVENLRTLDLRRTSITDLTPLGILVGRGLKVLSDPPTRSL